MARRHRAKPDLQVVRRFARHGFEWLTAVAYRTPNHTIGRSYGPGRLWPIGATQAIDQIGERISLSALVAYHRWYESVRRKRNPSVSTAESAGRLVGFRPR